MWHSLNRRRPGAVMLVAGVAMYAAALMLLWLGDAAVPQGRLAWMVPSLVIAGFGFAAHGAYRIVFGR